MTGWSRDEYFDDTGCRWVLPSPNIPTLDSAIVYPGTVLFEGTNVSEGRGTTRPFELLGAPWVDPEPFAAALNARRPPGRALPAGPVRTDVSQAREARRAAAVRSTSPIASPSGPVETGVALIEAFRDASPSQFAWRDPPYEYEADKPPIDILYGSAALREDFAAGRRAADLSASWPETVAPFLDLRRQFLLY